MELRHIKYFTVVAEELNFTRAAKRLRTSQPSLSQQIKDLEREIGAPLFRRNKRRVELTSAGSCFLNDSREILQAQQRAVTAARRAARTVTGELSIGFVPSAQVKVFPKILPIVGSRYPDIHITFHYLDGPTMEHALQAEEVDLAFLRKSMVTGNYLSKKVLSEELICVVPASHPLADVDRVRPCDIANAELSVISEDFAPELVDTVKSFLAREGFPYRPAHESANVMTQLNTIAMGRGIALLPSYAAYLGTKGVALKALSSAPTIDLYVAWKSGKVSPVLRSFVEALEGIEWNEDSALDLAFAHGYRS